MKFTLSRRSSCRDRGLGVLVPWWFIPASLLVVQQGGAEGPFHGTVGTDKAGAPCRSNGFSPESVDKSVHEVRRRRRGRGLDPLPRSWAFAISGVLDRCFTKFSRNHDDCKSGRHLWISRLFGVGPGRILCRPAPCTGRSLAGPCHGGRSRPACCRHKPSAKARRAWWRSCGNVTSAKAARMAAWVPSSRTRAAMGNRTLSSFQMCWP